MFTDGGTTAEISRIHIGDEIIRYTTESIRYDLDYSGDAKIHIDGYIV